jgi:hypothetical protein
VAIETPDKWLSTPVSHAVNSENERTRCDSLLQQNNSVISAGGCKCCVGQRLTASRSEKEKVEVQSIFNVDKLTDKMHLSEKQQIA